MNKYLNFVILYISKTQTLKDTYETTIIYQWRQNHVSLLSLHTFSIKILCQITFPCSLWDMILFLDCVWILIAISPTQARLPLTANHLTWLLCRNLLLDTWLRHPPGAPACLVQTNDAEILPLQDTTNLSAQIALVEASTLESSPINHILLLTLIHNESNTGELVFSYARLSSESDRETCSHASVCSIVQASLPCIIACSWLWVCMYCIIILSSSISRDRVIQPFIPAKWNSGMARARRGTLTAE